jgi:hypothetical protein
MKRVKPLITASFILTTMLILSCRHKETGMSALPEYRSATDSGVDGTVFAHRIIQDIIIKNNNPDDTWAEECLKGMQRKALVDSLFSMVYSQKAIAYDFDTNEKLTLKQVKKIEKKEGYSRDKIGKIQFIESWYLNTDNATMTKRVESLVLGYETYDNQGEFRGYLPVFRIIFNDSEK